MKQEIENIEITRLINSILYWIEVAFIMILEEGYRLIVINNKQVLIDQTYPTERGARIAFSKYYKDQKMTESEKVKIKAEWSQPYVPEKDWINRNLDLCNIKATKQKQDEDGKAAAVG